MVVTKAPILSAFIFVCGYTLASMIGSVYQIMLAPLQQSYSRVDLFPLRPEKSHPLQAMNASKQSLVDLRDVSSELQSLVFLHVPKCGGSTVRDRIVTTIAAKWNLQNLQTIKPSLNQSYWINTWSNAELKPPQLINDFMQNERDRIRVLTGHVAHGACRILAQPCRYVTVLREPRARLISEVKWIQKVYPSLSHLTTSEFIQEAIKDGSKTRHFCPLLDNHETRFLSGDSYGPIFGVGPRQSMTPCGFLRDEHAQLAINNLAHGSFQAVGTMEQMDLFFSRLDSMFDTDFGYTGKALNANKANKKKDDITPEAEDIIQSMIKYDIMVYEAAKKLWDA